jgi:hypothetical protein
MPRSLSGNRIKTEIRAPLPQLYKSFGCLYRNRPRFFLSRVV